MHWRHGIRRRLWHNSKPSNCPGVSKNRFDSSLNGVYGCLLLHFRHQCIFVSMSHDFTHKCSNVFLFPTIFLVMLKFFMRYALNCVIYFLCYRHLVCCRFFRAPRVEFGLRVELAKTLWSITFVADVAINEPLIQYVSGFVIHHFFKSVSWHRVFDDDSVRICLSNMLILCLDHFSG